MAESARIENEATAIVRLAQSLLWAILNSDNTWVVKDSLSQLNALASQSHIMGPTAAHAVMQCIQIGTKVCEEKIAQKAAEIHEKEKTYLGERVSAPSALEAATYHLWTDQERALFDAIDPNKHFKKMRFGVNGEPDVLDEDGIRGDKLREALALMKAAANRDKLTPEQRKALDKELCGDEAGHQGDPKKVERESNKLKEKAAEIAGVAAAKADSPEEVRKIKENLEKTHAAIDKLEKLELTPVPKGMEAPAAAIKEEAQKELKSALEAGLGDWMGEMDKSEKAQDKGPIPFQNIAPQDMGDFPAPPLAGAMPPPLRQQAAGMHLI